MTFGISVDVEREVASRRIVLIVLILLWLLVFEGALRKWFLPQFAKPLLFVKDPLVLYAYYLGIKHSLFPGDSIMLRLGVALSALFILLGILQCIGLNLPPQIALYGWRQYCLVIPLTFLIAANFHGKDLRRVIHQSMVMAAINAGIVLLQWRSPHTSWINSGVQDSAAFTYGEDNIARASGSFSFTFGHEMLCASVVPMLLTLWLMQPSQRGVSRGWMVFYTIVVLANVLLNGNRGVFVLIAPPVLACFTGFFLLKKASLRWRALVLPLVACLVGGLVYAFVFTSAYRNMSSRVASTDESAANRFMDPYLESLNVMKRGNIVGEGLGLGSGGGQALVGAAKLPQIVSEGELPRVLQESGFLGLLFMLYRFALAVSIVIGAFAASARSGNMLPVMLCSFVWQLLPFAQMSGNATCVYYGWLFAGFCLASNQMHLIASEKQTQS